MREYSSPPAPQVPTTGNLTDDVLAAARAHPARVTFSRATAGGWTDITAAEFLATVAAAAKGLVAAGVEPGDRVGLYSATRYEWTVLDYAIWWAGAVTVPLYETSSADQVRWILADSGARALVAGGPAQLARVAEVRAELPDLVQVWSIDDGAVDVLSRLGADVPDATLEQRRAARGPKDLATIIYTSGTTGRPKGCALTIGNFQTEVAAAVAELPELFDDDAAATLLFLPLAHVFARVIQVGAIRTGTRLGHTPGISRLAEDLQSFRPTFVLSVPRVFEKVFTTASQRATADGRGRLFDRATHVAIAWSQALDRGGPSLALRAQHAFFARTVYPRLLDALGGACRFAISGGAPLGERLGHFYRGIGLTVLEGYGLTETTAAVTVNAPTAVKIGSVGRPLPGTTVRVADDGELLFRGGQVFEGYWGDDDATAETLDDAGWLHSGDLGEVDDEGFVRITGRKKEIIVTAGGKNVAPAVLEERVRAHPLVSQCLVVGDGKPFIAALVTLDAESVALWASSRAKPGDIEQLADDPDVRTEIQAAVDAANRAVSRAESIRRFAVLPVEWTEETGELTPSLKLRRNVVLRDFRHEIAALYVR